MSILTEKHFHDETAAYSFVEARVWPNGPICPHCGETKRLGTLKGKSTRIGVRKCYNCRKPFRVTVGTIFEASHIKLNIWLQAVFLIASSKKGISANQLHRTLNISLKSAWFMEHRIREAMRDGVLSPIGGNGKITEADETYFGTASNPQPSPQRKGRAYLKGGAGPSSKRAILGLVERGGSVRTFHVQTATRQTVQDILFRNVDRQSVLNTDEAGIYVEPGKDFADHQSVNHSAGEYARGETTTNSIESVFSVFKRGMVGVYQHCGEAHLHRYLAEFDFRFNRRAALKISDRERAEDVIRMAGGKRLTYHQVGRA